MLYMILNHRKENLYAHDESAMQLHNSRQSVDSSKETRLP